MKTYLYSLILLLAIAATAGCGSKTDAGQNIALAREAIARADYQSAVSALDEALKTLSDSTASPSALTEAAVLYWLVDDQQNTSDYYDKALESYQRAISISPDSVHRCFSRLSADEKGYLDIIDKLVKAQTGNIDISDTTAANDSIDTNYYSAAEDAAAIPQ